MSTGIGLPESCPRCNNNCSPLSQITSSNAESFFCVGKNNGLLGSIPEDKYTMCFKGEHEDSMSLYDKRDLIHHAAVITRAVAIIEEIGD